MPRVPMLGERRRPSRTSELSGLLSVRPVRPVTHRAKWASPYRQRASEGPADDQALDLVGPPEDLHDLASRM